MSESKYRALLASVAASERRGVDWAAEIEAALSEPPVQAEPFWYAVVSDKAPVINKAIKRNDVATEYASQCSHEGVMIIPLYLHPPAAQDNQHTRDSAELRDLCSQRDGLKIELWRVKEERDSQQRIAIAAMTELAELKAVMAESLDNYRSMLHASEAQVAELKAKMEGAGRYTCIGKGGVYTRIGTSLGAGECRGEIIEVYRDAENGQLYHRESGDFFFRMTAAPSKEGL